jgi:hypothetical protein
MLPSRVPPSRMAARWPAGRPATNYEEKHDERDDYANRTGRSDHAGQGVKHNPERETHSHGEEVAHGRYMSEQGSDGSASKARAPPDAGPVQHARAQAGSEGCGARGAHRESSQADVNEVPMNAALLEGQPPRGGVTEDLNRPFRALTVTSVSPDRTSKSDRGQHGGSAERAPARPAPWSHPTSAARADWSSMNREARRRRAARPGCEEGDSRR